MNLNTSFKNYRKRPLSANSSQNKRIHGDNDEIPLNQKPKAQQNNIPSNTKLFNVLVRKFTTKKNKTWEADAKLTLNLSTNSAIIKNDDNIVIGKLKDADKSIFKGVFKCPGSGLEFQLDDDIIYSKSPKLNLSTTSNQSIQQIRKKPLFIPKNFKSPLNHSSILKSNKNNQVSSSPSNELLSKHSSKFSDSTSLTKNSLLKSKKKINNEDELLYDITNIKDPLFMPDLPRSIDESEKPRKIVIDPTISIKLRPHQRDGVKFLYSCLMGLKSNDIRGAILADEMGLGKTLQTITIIWTLLRQSPIINTKPVINKVLICCPVSLVNNWKNEFSKWLGLNRLNVLTINNNKYQNEKQDIELFEKHNVYQVMIIGYEKMQSLSDYLSKVKFDLLVCDEGHRLKNNGNKTMKTLESFNIRRKILLSGTPIQNDLIEFFTMANFTNPGIFGDLKSFQKKFMKPILDSRDSNCTNLNLIEKGREKSKELVEITNSFILRRTNIELTKYLPKRSDYIILVPPTSLQLQLFKAILESNKFKKIMDSNNSSSSNNSFNLITTFRKLCNSPSLLKDDDYFLDICEKKSQSPEDINFRQQLSKKVKSGKLIALIKLLGILHSNNNEKVIIVSNFTSSLDIIESLFKSLDLSFLRLDGSTPSNQRSKLVDKFNKSPVDKIFALLLSAKAGGTGLNLIGASRIILYDNDWNPAIDLQAIARIHRDGQKKEVKTYRLLTSGCIDEKIFQRQLVKQDLSDRFVDQKGGEKELFDRSEIKDIFNVQPEKIQNFEYCNTHEMMMCDCKGTGSIMINGRYYNDDNNSSEEEAKNKNDDEESDTNNNEEESQRRKEIMNFMSALSFSQKYPNQTDNSDLVNNKRKKIRRCMKGYRHINPINSDNTNFETDDNVLNVILNGQNRDNPIITYVFGKY